MEAAQAEARKKAQEVTQEKAKAAARRQTLLEVAKAAALQCEEVAEVEAL